MVEGVVTVVAFLLSAGPSLLLATDILFFPVRFIWKRSRRPPSRGPS